MFTVYVLGAANVSVSGGSQLSGFTQGDGSHLVGRSITLDAPAWQPVEISDNDGFFADNDSGQTLSQSSSIDGTSYSAGRIVEAEYTFTVTDGGGNSYQIIGFNINEPGSSHPSYGTIEGLAFVGPPGGWPPVGTPLTVVNVSEGPPNAAGPAAVAYEDHVAPICFVTGTRIATPEGERPVESLRPGDMVETRDNGAQPLLWVGRTAVGGTARAEDPRYAPVEISPGALGPGQPHQRLVVSRQHRLLLSGWQVDLMFGLHEVLVPAGALLGQPGFSRGRPSGGWAYHHLLCPAHEILLAEGAPAESFLPGPEACAALSPEALASLERALGGRRVGTVSRPLLKAWEGRLAL
ncbi:Hint domain-containing protein [Frigidibacter sp. ROC022]|uniref:Hint domain-containing protein n=1 Tax=Frigidibacter sp. ROC022 TaxID=2971796 RepID=UPI00215B6AF2|nr:Hint domain-containing protein [Frigidibacter sp. ROC022]MCR8723747.1 Hint domain-containing protein [Frigidibacter sp. ROC022]